MEIRQSSNISALVDVVGLHELTGPLLAFLIPLRKVLEVKSALAVDENQNKRGTVD